jgi:hypothetical protein
VNQDELIRRFIESGQRAQAAVNFQIAKAELRKLGITLTQRPGEYQVNLTGGPDENALASLRHWTKPCNSASTWQRRSRRQRRPISLPGYRRARC